MATIKKDGLIYDYDRGTGVVTIKGITSNTELGKYFLSGLSRTINKEELKEILNYSQFSFFIKIAGKNYKDIMRLGEKFIDNVKRGSRKTDMEMIDEIMSKDGLTILVNTKNNKVSYLLDSGPLTLDWNCDFMSDLLALVNK